MLWRKPACASGALKEKGKELCMQMGHNYTDSLCIQFTGVQNVLSGCNAHHNQLQQLDTTMCVNVGKELENEPTVGI